MADRAGEMDGTMRRDLDRYITGNYGEDQFDGEGEQLSLNDYQQAALRTAMDKSDSDMIQYCVLGLLGEAGEMAEHIKKAYYHGHALDREYLAKELGDNLWYLAVLADTLGFPLEVIATGNIAKLSARYPEGFSEERSQNRVEYGCSNCALYSCPGEHCKTAFNGKPCSMLEEYGDE